MNVNTAEKTILDNSSITMRYNSRTKILSHQMHRFVYGDAFRQALMRGVAVLDENKAQKWLSDDQSNRAVTADDNAWVEQEWLPSALKVGWKYWAIVQPDAFVAKLYMDRKAYALAKLGLDVQMFGNAQEALAWLEAR